MCVRARRDSTPKDKRKDREMSTICKLPMSTGQGRQVGARLLGQTSRSE